MCPVSLRCSEDHQIRESGAPRPVADRGPGYVVRSLDGQALGRHEFFQVGCERFQGIGEGGYIGARVTVARVK